MALTNSTDRYGGITKTFHWLTALLILAVIPLGIVAHQLPYDTAEQLAQKAWLFSLHKTVGVTIFFVAIARIAWACTQRKPTPVADQVPVLEFLANLAHWTLYASLILVPLTGWIHHSATTGFAPIWWPFGQSLPFVPKDNTVADRFATLHIFFERVLVISLLLHIAGALKHHVVDKDATLRRMWFGTTRAAGSTPQASTLLPPLAALGIFTAVGAAAAL
ncbi:MAG: cytochrome b, partial [Pseudomonadota bacterium]